MNTAPEYAFIVYSRASCTPPPNPAALASGAKRLDIIARVLAAGFDSWAKRPKLITVYLDNDKRKCLILFDRNCAGNLRFEKSAAALLISTLRSRTPKCPLIEGRSWAEAVEITATSIGARTVVLLVEGGAALDPASLDHPVLYVLGSDVDPPLVRGALNRSIGPLSYLASHVTAYVNYLYWYVSSSDDG